MSKNLALPTIDIGGPQLSMHSIREQCCTTSVLQAIQLYQVILSLTYRIHMIMFYMTLLSSMVGDSWGCVLLYRELFVSARGDDSASWPVVEHFVFHLNEQLV